MKGVRAGESSARLAPLPVLAVCLWYQGFQMGCGYSKRVSASVDYERGEAPAKAACIAALAALHAPLLQAPLPARRAYEATAWWWF